MNKRELTENIYDPNFLASIMNHKLEQIDLNDYESRKAAWNDRNFRMELSEYAGKVIADHTNTFFEGEITVNEDVIAGFFQKNDYFMLSFLWFNLERYVYVETITMQGLHDGMINAYSDFTTEQTRYTDNPIPYLEATYY